jgi:hypothetical protein
MPSEVSLLRHSIRGTINALKLGVSAMDTGLTREESIEFLDYIIQATDKMCTELDSYEALPDELKVPTTPTSAPSAAVSSQQAAKR